jgi:hypothetical protein
MTKSVVRLRPGRASELFNLDADLDDIIDIATMLCVVTASGDAESCIAGMNKSLWTIIDRANAIRGRLLKEPVAEAS